jgi:hypothetical protein
MLISAAQKPGEAAQRKQSKPNAVHYCLFLKSCAMTILFKN